MSAGLPAVLKTCRRLSARRVTLLATVAALSVGVLLNGPIGPKSTFSPFVSEAYAQSASRPVGFADIVEKVKPAVISVRVKVDSGPHSSGFNEDESPVPKGSPFEFFFKRFGIPEDEFPRGPQRHQFTMGQGSGFFISADGYAVTNNHVVDKAESVEVTTDEGKTYTAKVIGTDPRTDLALIKIDGRNDFPYVNLSEHPPRVGDWVLAAPATA
jgi:serine protease Do